MLEFNHEHVGADLSKIRSNVTKTGKVMLAGVILSAVILLSGCGNSTEVTREEEPFATAIIMENGNALLVDVTDVRNNRIYNSDHSSMFYDRSEMSYVLTTTSGDELIVVFNSFKLISGADSHEKAEIIAQSLISEDGQVTCYDEAMGMTR